MKFFACNNYIAFVGSAQVAVFFSSPLQTPPCFAAADSSVVMGSVANDPRLVARASALRKHWRLEFRNLLPECVVPHRVNRGGGGCNSARCTDLTGKIADCGFDPIDASLDAVCIMAALDNNNKTGEFQTHYENSIKMDPDMAVSFALHGPARYGSIGSSHGNCCLRNVKGGKRGCTCKWRTEASAVAGAPMQCTCSNTAICDANGNHAMDKLEKHDADW